MIATFPRHNVNSSNSSDKFNTSHHRLAVVANSSNFFSEWTSGHSVLPCVCISSVCLASMSIIIEGLFTVYNSGKNCLSTTENTCTFNNSY